MNALNFAKDLFFPRLCAACTKFLEGYESHICVHCQLHLPKIIGQEQEENAVSSKFWGKIKVKNTYSFLQFTKNGPVQHILHELKYHNKPELAEFLGQWFGKELNRLNRVQDLGLIVGIPLHVRKRKKRGYNQADCFAKGLSDSLQVPYSDQLLVRTKYTETQTKKSRYERFENIKDVFYVQDKDLVAGKHIALVDDVLTTGSTLEMAGARLIEAGCGALSILTIAAAK